MGLQDFLTQNWNAIIANPVPFITIFFIASTAGYAVASRLNNGVITNLRDRIDGAKEENERLKGENERLKSRELELTDGLKNYEVNLVALNEKVEAMEQQIRHSAADQAGLAELRKRVEAMPNIYVSPNQPEEMEPGALWFRSPE